MFQNNETVAILVYRLIRLLVKLFASLINKIYYLQACLCLIAVSLLQPNIPDEYKHAHAIEDPSYFLLFLFLLLVGPIYVLKGDGCQQW